LGCMPNWPNYTCTSGVASCGTMVVCQNANCHWMGPQYPPQPWGCTPGTGDCTNTWGCTGTHP
jgi:hypothetical protein